ncbi:MAG: flagellar basal body L-ring protein FlgH [Planctomycetota bacterium]|jgi:flagellar L-ring protein precursor FlgH|nr:flagellar basal body L-ring protein FlgH [Planctomycetota bacterium]
MDFKKARPPEQLDAKRLWIKCGVFLFGTLFFLFLAVARARGGDYIGYDSRRSDWTFQDQGDGYYSAADHDLAMRMQRYLIGDKQASRREKASRKHDSVTIVIRESTTGSLDSSNDLKRNSSNNMVLSSWLTPSLKNGLSLRQRGEASGDANASTPTLSYSSDRAHKSDSTIDRGQSLTSTLTGEVIEALPNGYLVIEAKKTVSINGEVQTLIITGNVNPEHMDAKSAVSAEYIMDMNIRFFGSGPMSRMDKRGWGARVYDFINPF